MTATEAWRLQAVIEQDAVEFLADMAGGDASALNAETWNPLPHPKARTDLFI